MSTTTTLRAMAENYRNGHQWDELDALLAQKAADEIQSLRSALLYAQDYFGGISMKSVNAEGIKAADVYAAVSKVLDYDPDF